MNIKNNLILFLGGIPYTEHIKVINSIKHSAYQQGIHDIKASYQTLVNDIAGCDSQTWIDTVYNAIAKDKITIISYEEIRQYVLNTVRKLILQIYKDNPKSNCTVCDRKAINAIMNLK